MKAKQFCSIILAVALVLSFTSRVLAAEDLSDWQENIWQGNISLTPDGTRLNVTADGSAGEAWRARYKDFANNVGLMVTVNVANVMGRPQIGIRKNVGKTPSGNWILAELSTDIYEDEKRIRYRVRERDDESNTLRVLSVGYLGDYDGGWSIGQDLVLGLARVKNEIWFYTPASGALIKVSPFDTMSALESAVQIYAWAQEGASDSISATVSDVTILYANDLKDLDQIRAQVEAFVTRFYQLCLDRDPDAAGLEGWTNNLLNQIQTGADVANGFIYSQEFINKNTTNDEYLTILYKAFFNRDPDPAGWDIWLAELNAGKDRGYVLNGFLGSQEFLELCEDYGITPN
jgi:hypothetical protein